MFETSLGIMPSQVQARKRPGVTRPEKETDFNQTSQASLLELEPVILCV